MTWPKSSLQLKRKNGTKMDARDTHQTTTKAKRGLSCQILLRIFFQKCLTVIFKASFEWILIRYLGVKIVIVLM